MSQGKSLPLDTMEAVPAASFAAGAEQMPKDWNVANAFRAREVGV